MINSGKGIWVLNILGGLLLQFLGYVATAQDNPLITATLHDASFEDFVQAIESQSDYHFYFQDKKLDSIAIAISVSNAHLPSVLDQVFKGSIWKYAINNSSVYISRYQSLALNLPEGFFSGQRVTTSDREFQNGGVPKLEATIKSMEEDKTYEIGIKTNAPFKGKANVAGYVRDAANGEGLSGVAIMLKNGNVKSVTDQFGYYSITLPEGSQILEFVLFGMFDTERKIILYSDGRMNVGMHDKIIQLKEVIVETNKQRNIRNTSMGVEKLSITAISQIPAVLGEVDVLRAVMSLPGVKSVGEASTGLNVRGGAADQNLILFNDMNIYNPSHLFGFFSAVPSDVVKNVTLYKSSIPANYGGRLSSVLDIASLDGNTHKLEGKAGIGLFTSKFSLNGPIAKDKTTFVISGRATYSDWLLQLLPDEYKDGNGSFYDGTVHLSHKFSADSRLYVNAYMSGDKFRLTKNTYNQYHNKNANISWKKNMNNRLYGVFMIGADHYDYLKVDSGYKPRGYALSYALDQYKFSADFNYYLNNDHTFQFGLEGKLYQIHSGKLSPSGKKSLVIPDVLNREQALQSAIYFSDKYDISSNLSLEGGIRLAFYQYLGPDEINTYAAGVPKSTATITGTDKFANFEVVKSYLRPDLRLSLRYLTSGNSSLKASYNSMHQFIHQLSNTTTMSPTDIWKLSDRYIRPQTGQQVSLGFYQNFKSNTIEASLEVYYRWMQHYLDYKSGANLVMNHHIETDVINTLGKAYGVELSIKKPTGKLNGWLGYTYSRTLIRQDDPLAGELINMGAYYPANYDQPHNINLVSNYKINHRFSISFTGNYSTGRPITLPIAVYEYAGGERLLYSDRNAYRIPDYLRFDLSFNIEGNHKVHQRTHNSWSFGIYNLLGRRNAYSVYFTTENGNIQGYKLSIFGNPIPFLTYHIRF